MYTVFGLCASIVSQSFIFVFTDIKSHLKIARQVRLWMELMPAATSRSIIQYLKKNNREEKEALLQFECLTTVEMHMVLSIPNTVRMNPVATHIFCPIIHPPCMEATMSTGIPYRQTSSSVSTRFSRSRL